MPTYEILQVDSFTNAPLGGNPCSVIFDTEDMDAATMQAIAREMNLSESAFVRRSTVADFGARYFTPAEEIPLAGHPTIATAFALVDTGRLVLARDLAALVVEGVAVGEVGVRAQHADLAGRLVPAHLPIVGDVAEDDVAAGRIVLALGSPVAAAAVHPESPLHSETGDLLNSGQ